MIHLIEIRPWWEVGASIATMFSAVAIVFVIIEYSANRSVRNIQLIQRCIDIFRKWFEQESAKVDLTYLEILNEELFYFQQDLIPKKVALEWIEGILDYILVYDSQDNPLNNYANQVNIEKLGLWNSKRYFYHRIHFFTHPGLANSFVLPDMDKKEHPAKKRELAKALYKHIIRYKY